MQEHTEGAHLTREVLGGSQKRRSFLDGEVEPVTFAVMQAHRARL